MCNPSLGCFIYFVLLMLVVNVLVKVHLKSVIFLLLLLLRCKTCHSDNALYTSESNL